MASTNFTSGTVVSSTWLNEVDAHVFEGRQYDNINAINVMDPQWGVVGDGVADDTTAIQAAINSLEDGDTIKFPGKVYKIGQLIFDGKSRIVVDCMGARFNLTGNNAGFVVKGVVTQFDVIGGVIVGDGTNRDSSPGTAQIGWLVGNEVGAYVQAARFHGVWVDAANVAFKCAYGTGSGSGVARHMKFSNCHAKDIVGTVSGVGYGFQLSQAPDSTITNCTTDNCQRHAVYLAEGRNYTVSNCVFKNHRSTIASSAYRVALSISRSRNVAVSNCVFDTCYDGTIGIDVDGLGLAPDNVSNGTTITGCVFYNSTLADIYINPDPAVNGSCRNINISDNVFIRAANNVASIVVEAGFRITINNNLFDGLLATGTWRCITLNGTDGASYTDRVTIKNNQIESPSYGIQVASSLQTGTSSIHIEQNDIRATTAELEFAGGENTTTNNNLYYKRKNGQNASRAYTSSGTNISLNVGGVDTMWLAASGATTVLSLVGGTTGQRLTFYFVNGNTTIKNTNIYLAGAADFTGTTYDMLSLVYIDGVWIETARSVN